MILLFKDVRKRLENRNIKLIGEYINTKTKTKWKCLVKECGYEWETIPISIFQGHGCPSCSKINKSKKEFCIRELSKRKIKLAGKYVNAETKTKWKCLVKGCGYEWETKPKYIFSGHGCHRCSKREHVTKEMCVMRLKKRKIKLIGEYKNTYKNTKWLCLVDGCKWVASPKTIMNGHGCPKCANKERVTKKICINRIKGRNIKLIGKYNGSREKTQWLCLSDGHKWITTPHNIFNGNGCPKCNASKGELFVNKWLEDQSIEFVPQKRFIDCRNKKPLPFDFFVPLFNTLIEYHGEQHFKHIKHFGGKMSFKETKHNDAIKLKYAKDKGFNFIQLDYTMDAKTMESLLSTMIVKDPLNLDPSKWAEACEKMGCKRVDY